MNEFFVMYQGQMYTYESACSDLDHLLDVLSGTNMRFIKVSHYRDKFEALINLNNVESIIKI